MAYRKRWITGLTAVIAGLVVYAAVESGMTAPPAGDTDPPARSALEPSALPPSPRNGRVTMIDLGASGCIPCKMMAPILEELKKEYAGRADILFIDVWKNPETSKTYGIRTIPTQIFFDRSGKEVLRHTGFMDKRRIIEILSKLGVS